MITKRIKRHRDISTNFIEFKIIATLLGRAFVRVGVSNLALTLLSTIVNMVMMLLSEKYPNKKALIGKIRKAKFALDFALSVGDGAFALKKYGMAGLRLKSLFATFNGILTLILQKALMKLSKKIVSKI